MMRPFRFGLVNEQMKPRDEWLAHVRRAQALGYSTFLIRDHFVPDFFGEQLAPLVALAAAASVTTTLRLGTLVIDNDYRHPVMLAKEAATLDWLSGGRLELGLGALGVRTGRNDIRCNQRAHQAIGRRDTDHQRAVCRSTL